MKKIIVILIIGITMASCQDFTSNQRYNELQYYLTGLLIEGKTVDFENPVIIGKTVPTEGGYFDDLFIGNADVMLYEIDDSGVILDSTNLFSFEVASNVFLYVDLFEYLTIKPEMNYRIEAQTADNELWAVTKVPQTIFVLPDSGYTADTLATGWTEMIYDNINSDHPIQIETQDNESFCLHIEFYCLEEWQNAQYVDPYGGEDYPEDEEEYEGLSGNDFPRKVISFDFYQPENNLVSFEFYQTAFVFYGRYQVTVSSIDDNYFHYLYIPEGYNHGGIHGGIGYFGSASSHNMFTKIVEE